MGAETDEVCHKREDLWMINVTWKRSLNCLNDSQELMENWSKFQGDRSLYRKTD